MSDYVRIEEPPEPGSVVYVSFDGAFFRRGRFIRISPQGRWKIRFSSNGQSKERAVEPALVYIERAGAAP